MKKPGLTLEDHREIGGALEAFRNEHLIQFAVLIQNATPKDSPQSKAVQKALSAIDELRSVMDDLVHRDYSDKIGDERIYYCDK